VRIDVIGTSLDYILEGPDSGPVVTFSHSLAATKEMWRPQIDALSGRYRVLAFDMRGHGASGQPEPPYTLEMLAGDVVGLLDALGVDRTHFVGLSIGGMIGQVLGSRHKDRLHSLTLCNTASRMPPEMAPTWDERVTVAREQGMVVVVEPTIERWFTAPFRERHPEAVDPIREMIRTTSVAGYAGCCGAIKALDETDRLSQISVPTLVIAGAHDPSTTPAAAQVIVDGIPGARLEILDAAHISNIEQEGPFTAALSAFLDQQAGR
jgi:3-oxoadipate enol-lactonase